MITTDFDGVLASIAPQVLIDARMRKREHPEVQRKLAMLVRGEPRSIAGHARDRMRFCRQPASRV